ncbi:stress protein, tellurium resistance protein [Psychromonas ingrahamii 37]|uniref:Stress protein, tellurium resistance protein n=1 Tax=Psychromonas ingrahamii (strain DSM 17664 / CCUG 51855 / 37) TaxID=357804 RepID=A1SUC8_PSYIN|nr:TerD family protein [Psychromonas ingrahamii]ABM03093.1 stress protein, tellurium resistance protein [Psychromonas ingrahamii 37]
MAVSLQKGGNVSLDKVAPGMTKCLLGLGWDSRSTDGTDFDLDASGFMVNAEGKVLSDKGFIFYGNLVSECSSVEHTGDNLTGEGEGDDEAIKINLSKVPADVVRIVIGVTIHEAESRKQNFGQVSNAFIRVVNEENNEEVARYDLTEDYSTETALLFGEMYRHNGAWKFKAVGQGFAGGLKAMAQQFNVNV